MTVVQLTQTRISEIQKRLKYTLNLSEDVLMYALFPQQAKDFLGRREVHSTMCHYKRVDVTLDLIISKKAEKANNARLFNFVSLPLLL